MNTISVLLLSVFLVASSVAQEKIQDKDKETKDQKFIHSNNICVITKKEQDDAKEYIISTREDQNLPLKLALTIVQLRLINNANFNDINCGLRFFIERYNEKFNRNWERSDESVNSMVSEYLKILEKLRTDSKTQAKFAKIILDSNEINYYYGILGKNVSDYSILDPNLARKFFTANLMSKSSQRNNSAEEWQVLFDLFYSKNIAPSKEFNDFLKSQLGRNGYSNSQLMNIYLSNVNDFAYNDLFKAVFENLPPNSIAMFFESGSVNPVQAKNVFLSKYLPENFKCIYARDTVAKNAPKLAKESIEDLKKLNVSCLNEALVDASKFTYPAEGCPQILFDKEGDHGPLLSKMSSDFSRSWSECRTKCNPGDKCIPVQDVSGLYSFLNSKFEKDLKLYKEIHTKNYNSYGMGAMPLKYDYKPVGICSERGVCGEKLTSCADSDILTKVNEELKAAKYQSCKVDTDCYVISTGYGGCAEFAINVNTGSPMQAMSPQSTDQRRRIPQNGMPNFLSSRLQKISENCGKGFSGWGCQQNSTVTTKCKNNLCILVK